MFTNTKQLLFILIISLMLLSGCSTMSSHSNYNSAIDFSKYKTYTWLGGKGERHVTAQSEYDVSDLDLEYIHREIANELTRGGFNFVEEWSEADMLVSYTIGIRDRVDLITKRSRIGGHWPFIAHTIDAHSYTEGTLSIDMYDANEIEPIWHGMATKVVTRKDRKKSEALISEAVAAILNTFPPQQDQDSVDQ